MHRLGVAQLGSTQVIYKLPENILPRVFLSRHKLSRYNGHLYAPLSDEYQRTSLVNALDPDLRIFHLQLINFNTR